MNFKICIVFVTIVVAAFAVPLSMYPNQQVEDLYRTRQALEQVATKLVYDISKAGVLQILADWFESEQMALPVNELTEDDHPVQTQN